jgi:hypothetical protein
MMRRTHCKHGHPLTGANVRVRPTGGLLCVTCKRRTQRRYWRKKRGYIPWE